MKKIEVMVEKFKSFDGKVFDNAIECFVHEINRRIETGEIIIVNELLDKNIINRFECNADSRVNVIHGIHHGKIEYNHTRVNLINSRSIKNSSFEDKKIVHIKYSSYNGVIVYVHFNKKDWNIELQGLKQWKNPKIIGLNYYKF